MITRIELTNFMSHAHTVIEPAPGLTVLVGPNNCGKSAVVAALQIICQNANSTYVRRHETSECVVQVHTDDGHVVRWSRKKSGSPKYLIDGQAFDRLGQGGVPDELHAALRLPRVDGGDDADFDVHFGAQKSPIFLIGSSPANAARFFASSSDAIRLVQMQKRHKEKLAERQRDKVRLEAESKRLNAELESLLPVAELERGIAQAEHGLGELQQFAEQIESALRDRQTIELQQQAVQRLATKADALQPLTSPPELVATEPLATAAAGLKDLQQSASRGQACCQVLQTLSAPPELALVQPLKELRQNLLKAQEHLAECRARCESLAIVSPAPQFADEQGLAAALGALAEAASQVSEWRESARALQSLRETPPLLETATLVDLVGRIQSEEMRSAACRAAFDSAQEQLTGAAEELRDLAESALCPTCGAPLDADRLLAAAGTGLGGHVHG